MNEQIDLAEFLVIAERVLGADAKALKSAARLDAAESALAAPFMGFGDTLFYTDPAQRAAIVCSRIIRNHPSPMAISAPATSACSSSSIELA